MQPESSGSPRPPAAQVQRAVVMVLLVLLCLASNAWRELVQPDEGRYAEIPREMLVAGDYVVPHLNGIAYIEKPPLQYWATAAAYRLFGVAGWVSRLWNLALGLAGIALVYLTGRSLWNSRAGEFAALVLASSPLYVLVGQLNLLDMGLTFFLTAALGAFLRAQRAAPGSVPEQRWMWLCWSSVGLAFLQKGLVAFAVPLLALGLYSLLQRDSGIWKRLHLVAGALILAVLTLPWLIALGLRDGAYAQYFLIHEHFTRFLTTEHHHQEAWWFFLAVLAAGSLPWTWLMLRTTVAALVRDSRPGINAAAALAVWAVVIVGFFSLSGSKLAPYIMPCMPPLALLAGRALDQRLQRTQLVLLVATAGVLAVLLLAAPAVAAALMADGPNRAAYLSVGVWARAAGAVAAVAVLLSAWAWSRGSARLAVACLGLGLHLTWMTFLGGANIMATVRGAPGAAALVAPRLAPTEPFYCVGAYLQSLSFELGRTCTLVEYTGELELQFGTPGGDRPATFAEFARRWGAEGSGIALMHQDMLARMAAAGLPRRILKQYPDFVIVEHP